VSAAVAAGCIARRPEPGPSLDEAARSYVRLALALGDRDPDGCLHPISRAFQPLGS